MTVHIHEDLYGEIASHLRRNRRPEGAGAIEDYITQSVRRNLDGRKEVQVVTIEHSAARWSYHSDDLYLTATGQGDGSVTIDIGIDGGHAEEPSYEIRLPERVALSLHSWLAP